MPVADYHDRDEWLSVRQSGVGGSEVGILFGVSPYATEVDLYYDKIGEIRELPYSPDLERGRHLEPVAADLFTRETGLHVRRMPLRRHPDYPHILASCDRQILATGETPTRALEIKCPRYPTFKRIQEEGLPENLLLQGQHECLVTGYPSTVFAIFHADSWSLLLFEVEADDEIHEQIIAKCGEFMGHVERREVPAPTIVPFEMDIPEGDGTVEERDDEEWAELAGQWAEAKVLKDMAEPTEKELRQRLAGMMAGGAARGAGVAVVTYETKGRIKRDWKNLEKVAPLDREKVREFLEGFDPPDDQAIDEALDEMELDLSQFESRGRPYQTIRAKLLT